MPWRASCSAQIRPAGPAPMMRIGVLCSMGAVEVGDILAEDPGGEGERKEDEWVAWEGKKTGVKCKAEHTVSRR